MMSLKFQIKSKGFIHVTMRNDLLDFVYTEKSPTRKGDLWNQLIIIECRKCLMNTEVQNHFITNTESQYS